MQTGPDPHSIEFEKNKFDSFIAYFNENPSTEGFDIKNAPKDIPNATIVQLEEIGVIEYRNLGDYKVFFCGYGVVGKGWGFIYGDFSDEEVQKHQSIKGNNQSLMLTYLEHLEGRWYRFAAG